MKGIISLSLLILLCRILVFAEQDKDVIYLLPETSNSISVPEKNKYEIELLKLQFESCKEAFDRVNTTYQWAMGIIITVILAFLGITGYNYHKNYKTELQKIKEELEQDYKKAIEKLVLQNSKSISDKTEIIEKHFKQKILELQYDFLTERFQHEKSEKQKLTISLNILNVLSDSNWEYRGWVFNDYFNFIECCCLKKIYFDHSEYDDVMKMLDKLPKQFENEKNRLLSVIKYDK